MSDQNTTAADLGPLEPILSDPAVTEIFVDSSERISIVRNGRLEDTEARFDSQEHLIAIIRALVTPLGQPFDESNPLVDVRFSDGSRMTAVISPIALEGPAVVFTKYRKQHLTMQDLVGLGSLDEQMVDFVRACVAGRMNIVVAGNSNSGKTTIMNLIAAVIPADERVITVEEVSEIHIAHRRIVRLESRPANLEGRGAVTVRDLVVQALRMYPERLIVGELRGGEVWPLIQAINNGHDGSMATMYATSPRDALTRLEIMATSADPAVPLLNVREQMAGALDLIVQISRLADGSRRITHVTEVQRLERDVILLQDIFTFEEGPRSGDGPIQGRFVKTGQIPAFLPKLRQRGVDLPADLFKPS